MPELSAWLKKNQTLWTRVFDEVISPELEAEWNKHNEAHQCDLQKKDEQQQILLNHVNDEVVKRAYLIEENAKIKTQLQRLDRGNPSSSEQQDISTDDAYVSVKDYRDLIDRYTDLNKRYQDCNQKIKYLEKKNNAVMQKNKEMKESVKIWQEYCDRKSGKPKSKAEPNPPKPASRLLNADDLEPSRANIPLSPGATPADEKPRILARADFSSPAPMAPLTHHQPHSKREGGPYAENRFVEENSHNAPTPLAAGLPRMHDLSSNSGHTFDLQASQNAPQRPSKLKSKLITNEDRQSSLDIYQEENNQNSSQVTEDEVTQKEAGAAQETSNRNDDDFPVFVSERSLKRKREPAGPDGDTRYNHSSNGTPGKPHVVKEEEFSSPPITAHKLLRKETMDLDEAIPHGLLTPHRRNKKQSYIHSNLTGTLRHQRSNSAPFIKKEREDYANEVGNEVMSVHRSFDSGDASNADARAFSEPSRKQGENEPNVLKPLDLNVISPMHSDHPKKRQRKEETRHRTKHQILAESGEETPSVNEYKQKMPPEVARANFNRRMKASRNVETSTKTTPRELQPPRSRPEPLRSAPSPNQMPIWTLRSPQRQSAPGKIATTGTSLNTHTRLRAKPVEQLQVQDFKANPAYNQGYTYAFSETVRKRGERMCLPGCTNPNCCGSTFRALAETLPQLSSLEEDKLLEDYLGDAYDDFGLTQMSGDERRELVLQARTRKIAKDHGKHRQAYEGRATPPGFWRMDFPSTQEQMDDREKARERERLVVKERYLEAMRKGGKWIFRDE